MERKAQSASEASTKKRATVSRVEQGDALDVGTVSKIHRERAIGR
jgi:hypothetical protein